MKLPRSILLFFLIAVVSTGFAQESQDTDLARNEYLIFKWVNQERARYNLPTLKWNDQLRDSARKHSWQMAQQDKLSHLLPGEAALMQRLAADGARMDKVAENVAYGAAPLDIWQSWLRSPPHRENIMNPQMNSIGVGLVKRGTRIYATQDFARIVTEAEAGEAANRLGKAFNDLRKQLRMAAVPVSADSNLTSASCAMAKRDKLDAGAVPRERGTSHFVVFTASQPENLPRQLTTAAHLPTIPQMLVGICYRVTKSYPGGIYWISVAY